MEKQILSFIARQFRVGVSKGEDEAETTIAFYWLEKKMVHGP